jgi:hypothetical protein
MKEAVVQLGKLVMSLSIYAVASAALSRTDVQPHGMERRNEKRECSAVNDCAVSNEWRKGMKMLQQHMIALFGVRWGKLSFSLPATACI